MKVNWILILRAKQMVLSVIILGLSAYVVNWYNTDIKFKSPTQVNFLVAAPILSIISVAYIEITSRFAKRMYNPYVAVGCDVVNAIMYFSGFIALAVFLSGLLFCRGTVCAAARADTVFAAFSWVAWTCSAIMTGKDVLPQMSSRVGARKVSARTQHPLFNTEMKDASSRA